MKHRLTAETTIKDGDGRVVGKVTTDEYTTILKMDGTRQHEFLIHFAIEEKGAKNDL